MENEKRLIDANALISAIDEYMKNAYDCPLEEVAEFQQRTNDTKLIYAVEGLYEATEIIDDAPTVDAVEVVHGRWGEYEAFKGAASLNGYPCSACGKRVSVKTNYCPNCCAKMDGGNYEG